MGFLGGRRSFLIFLPLILGAVLVFFPRRGTTVGTARELSPGSAGLSGEELVFLLQYVGSDYRGAVADGRVLDEFEYQEMTQFTKILVEEQARIGPETSEIGEGLSRLAALVEGKEDPAKVLALTRELVAAMTRELGLVTYPARAPRVEEGEKLFASACAQCHGTAGDGLGPSASGQNPPPTSFREARMKKVAPHQLYNAVGFGVEGTAMPSFEDAFSPSERWDVAFYLMTLREDFSPRAPAAPLPVSVRDLATLSDEELSASRGFDGKALDFYRSAVPETQEEELLRMAERKLAESYGAFQNGDRDRAVRLSIEAYLEGIEPTEATLLSMDARLVRNLERELTQYRAQIREGADREAVAARLDRIQELTADARKTLSGSAGGFGFAFLQSAAIILREGIEAALLVALLLSYLAASGIPELRRYILGGALAGILAGGATWLIAQVVIESSTLQREALEGVTSLLAAAVLFSVSFWILHNADLKRWKSYIREKATRALGTGSGLALAMVSFLAVYREAFETVLFYQALWLRSGSRSAGAIAFGLAVGLVVLLGIIALMFRYGKKIPLKPFFAITGVLLGILSLVFAGYGIAELQKIGWIQETPLDWVPYVPFLELQPTVEGLSLQLGIFLSFLLSWFFTGAKRPMSEAPAT
jgi:high-affinity iron transporter